MTLTQAATLTRRFILIFLILTFLGSVGFTGYKIWYTRYLASLPPPEEKPDQKFGILPILDFPQSSVSSSNFSYSLDTQTGSLPALPKITKVFFMPKVQSTFLAPEKATKQAEKFNLKIAPEIPSETKYRYKDKTRTLLIDLDTGNFFYKEEATPSALAVLEPDGKNLIDNFKNFLSSKITLPEEVKNGLSKLKISTDNQIAQIYIWPQNIDEKPIVTPSFLTGLVSAQVTDRGRELENYLSLNYIYHPVDQTTFATYSIKSADVAFNELRSGQATVIVEPPKPQVSITSVYLAYYQEERYRPFLQPMIVFEGINFAAYVDAIAR